MPSPSASYDEVTITVANNGTESVYVPIGNPTELGLFVPTLNPATTLTIKVATAADGTGKSAVFDGTGTQKLVYASGTGGFAISSNELGACLGYKFIGVLCGTTQTGGAKTFTLTRKLAGVEPTV